MEFLGSFGDFEDEFGEDGLDSKEENKTLMFKKKFRFKSPSMDARSTPMGFSGLKNRSVSTRDGSDLNGLFGKTDAWSLKRDSRRKDGNVHLNSVQNEVNKWEKERGDLRKEMGSINALETLTKVLSRRQGRKVFQSNSERRKIKGLGDPEF
uniref:Uncharacterized protein n=1 Tax=Populus davidiana TaxID=266767 RepID=A0A6M2EJD3_9ROSI